MENRTLTIAEAAQAFDASTVCVFEPLPAEDAAWVILAQGKKVNLKGGKHDTYQIADSDPCA